MGLRHNNSGGGSHKTMKTFGLLLSLLLVVSNGKVLGHEWESFKKVWGKEYQPDEDLLRHSLWESNKALVENHNMKAEKSFTLALNEASDWTEEEVKNFRLGYIDFDEGEGKSWGQDGYIHMKMGENNCGLASRPVYPVLDIYMSNTRKEISKPSCLPRP